jgi:uncharacterized protein YjbI with pentapeptide repeats
LLINRCTRMGHMAQPSVLSAVVIGLIGFCCLAMPSYAATTGVNVSPPLMAAAQVFIPGAKLNYKRLYGSRADGLDLHGIHLKGAQLHRSSFMGAKLNSADLRQAQLQGAQFAKADLAQARLNAANLTAANCKGANLSTAQLPASTLRKVDFSLANLSQANLMGARLEGANLATANLDGAQLRFARYDSSTVFPTGFDPKQHGLIDSSRVRFSRNAGRTTQRPLY